MHEVMTDERQRHLADMLQAKQNVIEEQAETIEEKTKEIEKKNSIIDNLNNELIKVRQEKPPIIGAPEFKKDPESHAAQAEFYGPAGQLVIVVTPTGDKFNIVGAIAALLGVGGKDGTDPANKENGAQGGSVPVHDAGLRPAGGGKVDVRESAGKGAVLQHGQGDKVYGQHAGGDQQLEEVPGLHRRPGEFQEP